MDRSTDCSRNSSTECRRDRSTGFRGDRSTECSTSFRLEYRHIGGLGSGNQGSTHRSVPGAQAIKPLLLSSSNHSYIYYIISFQRRWMS